MVEYLDIMSPNKHLDVSNGALIDRMNNTTDSIARKKREIGQHGECEIICKRIASAKSIGDSNELYLKRVFEKCLNDCMS